MRLQVWLPLRGNLNNQGLSDLNFRIVSSSNTIVNSDGKIGSCYANNSVSAGGIISDKKIHLGMKQSVFCWIKFTSLNSSSALGLGACGQHRHGENSGMGITVKYVSSTTGYLSVNTGTGTARTYNLYTGSTLLTAGIWYHVGYTYDGSKIKLYLNGKLDGSYDFAGMCTPTDYFQVFCWSFSPGATIYDNYKTSGYINDVRAYDHCLSAREVKEISKGLSVFL